MVSPEVQTPVILFMIYDENRDRNFFSGGQL